MNRRSHFRRPSSWVGASLLCTAGLAGAAHAGEAPFGRMVVFGDSISDGGAYADRAEPGRGRFTTNPDPVWVEMMARELGLSLTSSAVGGLNYAEGGARVSATRDDAPGDLSRRPVTEQVRLFLEDHDFRPDDLVVIQGGGNDVFHTQRNGLDFTPEDLEVLEAAAGDLARTLTELQAQGAQWLVTTSVPEFEPFNAYYREAVAASGANVLYFDAAGLIGEIKADPERYGLKNITDPACLGQGVQSFNCGPEDLVEPDANRTYLFADRVHFTGAVHEMKGQATLATVRAAPQLASATRLMDASEPASADWLAPGDPGEGRSLVAELQLGRLRLDDAGLSGEADVSGLRLGTRREGARIALGVGLALTDADAELGSGAVSDWTAVSLAAFAERRFGPTRLRLEAGWSEVGRLEVERRFEVGPSTRVEAGETSGEAAQLALVLERSFSSGGLRLEPSVSLNWRRLALEGFSEGEDASTQLKVAAQRQETTELAAGLRLGWTSAPGAWSPFARMEVRRTLSLDETGPAITPVGAPSAFVAPIDAATDTLSHVEAGVTRDWAGGQVTLAAGWSPTGPVEDAQVRLAMSRSF